MPVEDHPISDKVRHTKHPAGCYNSGPPDDGYYAKDRKYTSDGRWFNELVWIPHKMSTKCRQTLQLPECDGCTAEKDVEYIERMTALK